MKAEDIKFIAYNGVEETDSFSLDDIAYEGFPDICLDDSGENIMPHIEFRIVDNT